MPPAVEPIEDSLMPAGKRQARSKALEKSLGMGARRDFFPYVVVDTGAWPGSRGSSTSMSGMRRCHRPGDPLERLALVVEFELFRA
jgi:hypothetical protein